MKTIKISSWAWLLLIMVFFETPVSGQDLNPGSLLLYPYFSTQPGNVTVITVTNQSPETVQLRIVFISEDNDCLPINYYRSLTGFDTLTFLDSALFIKQATGFLYIYVVESYGNPTEKKADCLVGQEVVFETIGWESLVSYGLNALAFRAHDITPDGKLHLDDLEYDVAPKTIHFSRFFGQDQHFRSRLALISFHGKYAHVNAGVVISNDNESTFSISFQFPCFWQGELKEVCYAFTEEFLLSTNHDPEELWDGSTGRHKKTGWFEMTGINTVGPKSIWFPSIYGYLVEHVGPLTAADLPWQIEDPQVYNKAVLWRTSPDGR